MELKADPPIYLFTLGKKKICEIIQEKMAERYNVSKEKVSVALYRNPTVSVVRVDGQ